MGILYKLLNLDYAAYRKLYPDLVARGVDSPFKAILHWIRFGRAEERVLPQKGDNCWTRPHPYRIIIDVTTRCDIRCSNCNRSCGHGQAPDESHFSPAQMEYFIRQSHRSGRRWEIIRLEGGEPTLNPHILELLGLLAAAKERIAPRGRIVLCTNGHGPHIEGLLDRLPAGIEVFNSGKTDLSKVDHQPFNLAPIDSGRLAQHDYSRGCCLPPHYGIGLNRHGYYPHPICGGIDRVFGFDLGRKVLVEETDDWAEVCSKLCRYCGFYLSHRMSDVSLPQSRCFTAEGEVSPTWAKAFNQFALQKPTLSNYGE